MVKRRNFCAFDTMLLFVAALIDGSLGFVKRREPTWMNVVHAAMVGKVRFHHSGEA